MPKGKGKGNGESPDSSLLTYGPGKFIEAIADLRYSRYRWDSILRLILMVGVAVLFVILLNEVFPSAGAVVQEYAGSQLGATFLAGVADTVAYTIETSVGLTFGATAADGASMVAHKVILPYPSPDYKPLSAKERLFVLERFRKFDPTLPMSMDALNTISGALISKAIAFDDVRDVFLNAHKLLFKGKIKALMSIPEIREYILTEATKDIEDEEERQSLFDKYRDFSYLSRIRPLGAKFPDGSFIYYGAVQFYRNISEAVSYRRRRGKDIFCNSIILSVAGGTLYGIMFALPGAEPRVESFLANELGLSSHMALYALASTGVTLLGASIGAYISQGLYKIYGRCRYGVVQDFALSPITDRELLIINANMPRILRHEDGCTISMGVIFNLDEINSSLKALVINMKSTGVDHEAALLDLVHGNVAQAFMHPITGPVLADRLISDVDTRVALLRQYGFPGHAVDTARDEIVRGMRTVSQLRAEMRRLLREKEDLQSRNLELRASYDQALTKERTASGRWRRVESLQPAHRAFEHVAGRARKERLAVEMEMRPLRRSSASVNSLRRMGDGDILREMEEGNLSMCMVATNPLYHHLLRVDGINDHDMVVESRVDDHERVVEFGDHAKSSKPGHV